MVDDPQRHHTQPERRDGEVSARDFDRRQRRFRQRQEFLDQRHFAAGGRRQVGIGVDTSRSARRADGGKPDRQDDPDRSGTDRTQPTQLPGNLRGSAGRNSKGVCGDT